jgi:hypothetical protein
LQIVQSPWRSSSFGGEFEDGDTITMDVRNGELDFIEGEARVPVMA